MSKTQQPDAPEPETDDADNGKPPASYYEPRSRSGLAFLVWLVFILQLAMAGFYVYRERPYEITPEQPAPQQRVDHAALGDRLSALEDETALLREDIGYLESAVHQLNTTPAIERFGALQARVAELEAQSEAQAEAQTKEQAQVLTQPQAPLLPALSEAKLEQVLALAGRIEALHAQVEQAGQARWQAIQLLSGFERLEQRILGHEPYAGALNAFRLAAQGLDGHDRWIRALSRYQHEGIPSPEALASRFDAAREAALAPAEGVDNTLWEEVKQNLSQLVRVRKTGAQHVGDDPASVLARAAWALEAGETELLLDELAALPVDQRAYFDDFLAALHARERIIRLLAEIRSAIQASVQAARPTAEPNVAPDVAPVVAPADKAGG